MTQFEKDFILKCLDFFKTILSRPEELKAAISSYSETKSSAPRYHSNSVIPQDEYWTKTDKLNFSAAVFESTARANYYFLTQIERSIPVSLATAYWQSAIIPLLATNTDPNYRINSILNNCSHIQVQIDNEVPSDNPYPATKDNPYSFFATIAMGMAVAVVGVTLALTK